MSRNTTIKVMNDLFIQAQDVAPVSGARIVAAIYNRKGNLFSVGYNNTKTHSMAARFQKNKDAIQFHAEVHAIYNACKRFGEDEFRDMKNKTMYIVRAKKPRANCDEFIRGNSNPCVGCRSALHYYKFSEVVYSTDEDKYSKNEFGLWYPND